MFTESRQAAFQLMLFLLVTNDSVEGISITSDTWTSLERFLSQLDEIVVLIAAEAEATILMIRDVVACGERNRGCW